MRIDNKQSIITMIDDLERIKETHANKALFRSTYVELLVDLKQVAWGRRDIDYMDLQRIGRLFDLN